MLTILILVVFSLIWYLPSYKRQGKTDRLAGWKCLIAVLVGLIPVFIITVALQVIWGRIPFVSGLKGTAALLNQAFIEAGLFEELLKFAGAFVLLKIFKPKQKIGFALLFGGVGLGFHLIETGLTSAGIFSAVLGSVLAYHLFWQYWMGMRFFDYLEAKKRGSSGIRYLLSAFIVPVLLHGVNDFIAFKAGGAIDTAADDSSALWMAAYLVWFMIFIVFIVITLKQVKNAARLSREAFSE